MSIEIKITGQTMAEIAESVTALAAQFRTTPTFTNAPAAIPAQPGLREIAEALDSDQEKTFPEPKKPRGRSRKEAAEVTEREETAKETTETVADVPEQETAPTLDDVRTALADLVGEPDGKNRAKTILAKFDITRISDLPEEKTGSFMAAIARARA